MKKAYLSIRHASSPMALAFRAGLEKHGFVIHIRLDGPPESYDIALLWNRVGNDDLIANRVQKALVAENSPWGNGFMGRHWVSIARDQHNTARKFPIGSKDRWNDLGAELQPFRCEGETVILPQRGIGSPPTAMPQNWGVQAQRKYDGRIRAHPGRHPCKPLEEDLAHAGRVITWGSGAAVQALMMGIPVISEMPNWIAKCENMDESRLEMFQNLAWAQWTIEEVAAGVPFERLI